VYIFSLQFTINSLSNFFTNPNLFLIHQHCRVTHTRQLDPCNLSSSLQNRHSRQSLTRSRLIRKLKDHHLHQILSQTRHVRVLRFCRRCRCVLSFTMPPSFRRHFVLSLTILSWSIGCHVRRQNAR
jgi:hypothetical protein